MKTHVKCHKCGNHLIHHVKPIGKEYQWITVVACPICDREKFNEGYKAGIEKFTDGRKKEIKFF